MTQLENALLKLYMKEEMQALELRLAESDPVMSEVRCSTIFGELTCTRNNITQIEETLREMKKVAFETRFEGTKRCEKKVLMTIFAMACEMEVAHKETEWWNTISDYLTKKCVNRTYDKEQGKLGRQVKDANRNKRIELHIPIRNYAIPFPNNTIRYEYANERDPRIPAIRKLLAKMTKKEWIELAKLYEIKPFTCTRLGTKHLFHNNLSEHIDDEHDFRGEYDELMAIYFKKFLECSEIVPNVPCPIANYPPMEILYFTAIKKH